MNVAKILILPALFISLILPTGCQEEIPQTVTSVMLDETFVTMIKGSTHRLSAVVLPEGIETSLEWTSTDTLVATVSQDGDVLAVEEGQCRIWARSGAFMAVCDVEVLKVPAESIVLNETSIEIMPGEQFQLTATINMQEVRSEDILEWSSSDMNVAVVDSAGMVTAMKTGEATVTAEFMGVTAECKINVVDIPVSEIRLSSDKLSLFAGETSTIEAVILPINATDQEISWTSSDASVASVSAAGEVTALATGETTITAECGGITEECSITVVMPDAKTGDYYYSDGFDSDDASYDECMDDLNRSCAELQGVQYSAPFILSTISDGKEFFETKADYARDMVTGFIRLNGVTVGAVANGEQEMSARGAQKAADFVNFCDAFNIPVLTVTNVKGYKASLCSERNLAKAAARLTYAFANATVPKVNVIAGEAFGSAYVTMNSKGLGADLVFAWKDAKIGMMDAGMAAKVMYADADAQTQSEKAKEYAALQDSVEAAARRGYVDAVIDAADTRKQVIGAFEMLFTKREGRPDKKHGTV